MSCYPSDLQTALQKLHVTHSEDRDRTEELFDLETSHPVSSRTKSKVNCEGVSRGASEEIDYEDSGSRDGGVFIKNNIVHLAARGCNAIVSTVAAIATAIVTAAAAGRPALLISWILVRKIQGQLH